MAKYTSRQRREVFPANSRLQRLVTKHPGSKKNYVHPADNSSEN